MTALTEPEPHKSAHLLEQDLALLKTAVKDAGELALTYFQRDISVKQKADGSEVSEADLAVDAALHLDLLTPRPDYGWLSEEMPDDRERLKHRRVWVVDPIDGTRAFLRQMAEWTVSVALVEDGEPVLGAVFNPATHEFFHARRGAGAFLNDAPIHVSARAGLDGAELIASGGLFKKRIWQQPWPEVRTRWVNSVAYRLALVAAGKADATISLSAKSEWDLAAGALLVQEAGGSVTDHRGEPLRYNRPNPRFKSLVAASPALAAAIVERTRCLDL